jgi:hypothetical protein
LILKVLSTEFQLDFFIEMRANFDKY